MPIRRVDDRFDLDGATAMLAQRQTDTLPHEIQLRRAENRLEPRDLTEGDAARRLERLDGRRWVVAEDEAARVLVEIKDGALRTRVRRPVTIPIQIQLLLPVLMLLLVARLPTNTSVLDGHLVHPEQLDASIQKLL